MNKEPPRQEAAAPSRPQDKVRQPDYVPPAAATERTYTRFARG